MCTSGALNKKWLFKNRDIGLFAGLTEDIKRGHGVYRYIGVAGHATPKERGLNSGINEKGIAAQMTYVGAETLEDAINSKLPRGVLIETILSQTGTLDEALSVASSLLLKYNFVGGNITINSPQGVAVIEQLHPRFSIERFPEDTSWIVRTNHFENLILPEGFLENERNSHIRSARFHELLAQIDTKTASAEDIRKALSDHENGFDAICRHEKYGFAKTVSTAVYDLEKLRLFYIFGNPCENEFTVYDVRED